MSQVWAAFSVGLFIGALVGILLMCLCYVASSADRGQR